MLLAITFQKSVVLEASRLEQKLGPPSIWDLIFAPTCLQLYMNTNKSISSIESINPFCAYANRLDPGLKSNLLATQSIIPIKNKQNLKVLRGRRQYTLFYENYPAFKALMRVSGVTAVTQISYLCNSVNFYVSVTTRSIL